MSTRKVSADGLAQAPLPIVVPGGIDPAEAPHRRLPEWLKRPIPSTGGMGSTGLLIDELGLETICESARCPNRADCWTRKTAAFLILGNVCTRPCGFCAVPRGRPEAVADDEPGRLAEACARLGLRHVVITSVTRDDLPDGGAEHFRRC
ncbi:MAG TPA: radical SAM protein, partial [Isosphaeraceae bacterium]